MSAEDPRHVPLGDCLFSVPILLPQLPGDSSPPCPPCCFCYIPFLFKSSGRKARLLDVAFTWHSRPALPVTTALPAQSPPTRSPTLALLPQEVPLIPPLPTPPCSGPCPPPLSPHHGCNTGVGLRKCCQSDSWSPPLSQVVRAQALELYCLGSNLNLITNLLSGLGQVT